MTADFPGSIVSYRAKANKSGVVYDAGKPTVGFAEDFEKLEEEVVAIETALGTDPKGIYATVKAWLTALSDVVFSGNLLSKIVKGQFITLTYKATPVTADVFIIEDSVDTQTKKYTYFDDIKNALKTYFDTLYTAVATFNDHSARHENGGDDEISVAGLSGALADAQTPTGHEASHTAGGSDELDGAKLEIEKAIAFFIDGGGSAITTGIKGAIRIPFKCEILSVSLLGDQSGSIVVNIWKDTLANYPPTVGDKITDTTPPTITTDTDSEDATLTSWTKAIASGDVLMFNVDSVTDIEWASLIIKVKLVE